MTKSIYYSMKKESRCGIYNGDFLFCEMINFPLEIGNTFSCSNMYTFVYLHVKYTIRIDIYFRFPFAQFFVACNFFFTKFSFKVVNNRRSFRCTSQCTGNSNRFYKRNCFNEITLKNAGFLVNKKE